MFISLYEIMSDVVSYNSYIVWNATRSTKCKVLIHFRSCIICMPIWFIVNVTRSVAIAYGIHWSDALFAVSRWYYNTHMGRCDSYAVDSWYIYGRIRAGIHTLHTDIRSSWHYFWHYRLCDFILHSEDLCTCLTQWSSFFTRGYMELCRTIFVMLDISVPKF